MVRNLPANTEDIRNKVSVPWSGRFPGGGHGNPLQYSRLENPMDRGAWRACRELETTEVTKHTARTSWIALPSGT